MNIKLNPYQTFFVWLTLDSIVAYFVWNKAIVPPFHAPELAFGYVFVIIFGLKMLVRPIFEALNKANNLLVEIRDVLHFSEQMGALKFQAIAGFLDLLVHVNRKKAAAPEPVPTSHAPSA